ncbi:MAG: immune inhibitor A [Crocinitomicaceae bacterium]|nr:immune inhibitor A [Crocinitomicaceae bacterium]
MRSLLLLLGIVLSGSLIAQNYSRVQIFVNPSELDQLNDLGINLDHAHFHKGQYIQAELSAAEIQKLDQHGFNYQITVADLESYYENRLQQPELKTGAFPCDNSSVPEYTTPNNFSLGTMGGYLKYAEFLANLDSMASKYPNLITAKAGISTFQTHEGRPIYFVRISDNPGVDEGETQVLYTAIHHAREPASLSQLIYYMWYLLENYASDPEIQYLVDNNDLFFVPMMNPDGYIYNETTNPNGGGMWRKNRRNNGGGVYGVDNNRNYGYEWGNSLNGTSTNASDETFRGPSAFSEPENQAIKWLCENNTFIFAANAHTYGNLLLFPYGWANNMPTPDHDYYLGISEHMVQHNGYTNQISSALYPAVGDSDDWMYGGDLGTKPKIFAFTPEIGSDDDGFWPASSKIDQICKDNVFQNMRLAHLPHVYGAIQDLEDDLWDLSSDYINFELTRYGLTSGDFTVSITPLTGIASVGAPKVFSGMQELDVVNDSISYTLNASINQGDEIRYVLNLDNGTFIHRDTMVRTYSVSNLQMTDPGNDLSNWTSINWATTTEDFVTPSTSITDSPNQNYVNNVSSQIESAFSVDLSNSTQAYVSFWAKWDIENNYDFVQFEVSNDNGVSWIPMCGNYTNLGTSNQNENEPLYDDVQDWVKEIISLEDFLGETIKFRFYMQTDIFVNGDGFYFDDFTVYNDAFNSINEFETEISLYPNPAKDLLYIDAKNTNGYFYQVTSLNGKILLESDDLKFGQTAIDLSGLSSGMYIVSILDNNKTIRTTNKVVKR